MSSRHGLEAELARLTERYEAQPAGRVFAPLADCHRKLGQLDSALQICLTGLARHPEYSSAQLILGKIFLDRGEDDRAGEALERVLELDPHNLLAMRLLAELAGRRGELHEAEVRWRQLDALDYDPELTEERLADLARRRQEPQPEDAPAESGPEAAGTTDARADDADPTHEEPAHEEPAEEPVGESAGEPAPEEPSAPAPQAASSPVRPARPAASSDTGHTSEIATLTLASIYAEQGFKSKALEIYRAIASRNPDLPGLQDRIDAIEAAMARVERHAVEEIAPEDGRDGLEVVAAAPGFDAPDDTTRPVPSEPLFSDVPSRADPVTQDASRYRRFGTWLERVRSDDED